MILRPFVHCLSCWHIKIEIRLLIFLFLFSLLIRASTERRVEIC